MHFEIYKGGGDQWYWRVKARNGRIVAVGGEGYQRQRDALRTCRRVRGLNTWPIRMLVDGVGWKVIG